VRNGSAPPAAAAAVAAAVAACLFGAVTWQVVVAGPLTAADIPVHEWVLRHGLGHASPRWVVLSELGDARVALPVLAVVAAMTWWRRRRGALRPLLAAAVALSVSAVILEAMKAVIGRADPGAGSDAAFAGGGAFPSGHTFGATVMWGLAVWLAVLASAPDRPRTSRYACLAAGAAAGLAAGAAMVRMAYHWVSDVPGGLLLGMITLLTVLAVSAHRPALAEGGDLAGGEPGRGEHGVGAGARAPGG
jgi:membrane-associated phospholipid phosphatase